MESFFKVKTPQEVFAIITGFGACGKQRVAAEKAAGRVLAEKIVAAENLPEFMRSTVDGYAVRACDTFGANESLPAFFQVCGEVPMGSTADANLQEGQTFRISTGGMLPQGADGVVMVEYSQLLDNTTVEIRRAISPLENVIRPGDDYYRGTTVLEKDRHLRPQDLGALAGLGLKEVAVYRKPKVAIISTGDELVPIDMRPRPGQVRDINRYTLSAFCRRRGAEPVWLGLCGDDFESLKMLVERGLQQADMIWISGGSSVGTRDLTLEVFDTIPGFELLVHGISISPGKPTIVGRSGEKPVVGLPGHVASALVVAEVFLTRLIARLAGHRPRRETYHHYVEAELTRNVESASGREDYLRVRLIEKDGKLIADPIFGKSGLISTLVESDGLLPIDINTEGLYQGLKVKVMLL
jgi:molybdopterin molybdotransferase